MVSVEKENAFQCRDYLHHKVRESTGSDPFKICFLSFLGLKNTQAPSFNFAALSLYQKCAIAGLNVMNEHVSIQDLFRLLGQSAKIDSTPMPWVSDVFGVMALKWLIEKFDDEELQSLFKTWCEGFLPAQVNSRRFNDYETDIARYITNSDETVYSSACIPLFLHCHEKRIITDHKERQFLIGKFMLEFKEQTTVESPTSLLCLAIYVFDKVNQEISLIPPNGWTLNDLLRFLGVCRS